MRQKSVTGSSPSERLMKTIRRATRKQYSAEEKIRIVLGGLRGESSIAELMPLTHPGRVPGLFLCSYRKQLFSGNHLCCYRNAEYGPLSFSLLREQRWRRPMPTKIVDLSARSEIIRDEPFHVHFWECTPREFLKYLGNPRKFLESMEIKIPSNCRIETTIENNDWLGDRAPNFKSDNGPVIVCNIGGGNVARSVYRVVSYAHAPSTVGKFKKKLLHEPTEQQAKRKR